MPPSTPVLAFDRDHPDPAPIAEAARILRAGGLVAFATETVYGLGADATNPEAVARIFAAKGRPATNPLIVHASDMEMARSCVRHWTPIADELAEWFWPGPITLVLPRSSIIPDIVTAGRDTVGVRIPALRSTRDLIAHVGRPVAAPSANRSNRLSPTTAEHVRRDLSGRIDLILDSGPTRVGLESTVVDLTDVRPRILRPGPITARDLRRVLVGVKVDDAPGLASDESAPQSSPGQLSVHYAPRTRALRVEERRLADLKLSGPSALLTFAKFRPPASHGFQRHHAFRSPEEAAEGLYRLLHSWDDEGFSQIVVVLPPDDTEWAAVRDRLMRATVEA